MFFAACASPDGASDDDAGTGAGGGGTAGGTGSGGSGMAGASGAAGATGSAGSAATAGTTGAAGGGSSGSAGSSGSSGSAGSIGGAGNAGGAGSAGTSGAAGASAGAGASGRGGSTGAAGRGGAGGGVAGVAGTSGTAGRGGAGGGGAGTTGLAGAAGTTGVAGRGGSGGGAGTTGAAGRGGSGGGAVGTGGSGTGGAAGTGVCTFASGLNVAWVNFANDVPNPNLNTFNTIFRNTYNAGGRVVRWWFHTNGTVTPGYNSDGTVRNIQQSHIDGVKAILNAAHTAGVGVNISLWSFDMLQSNAGNTHTQNQQLLENDTIRQSYVTNYLTPLVTALRGTPGLYSYEIFNEPEGMGPKGWATYRTTEAAIQKCVNWFADAIHAADPNVPVTNGAVTFDYCSNVSGKTNYYSDAQLRSVGGRQNGILNFYEVHYYTSNGTSNSCFMHNAAYWKLDKKLVMGEFAAAATEGVAQADLYTHIYNDGYNGAWAWSYDADWPWPAMQQAMQNVYNAHTAEIGACP